MLHTDGLSDELKNKALSDSNPVIRMLAVKNSHISESDEPELHAKLKSDKSPFVRAAMHARNILAFPYDLNDLRNLSHIERLGAIALSDSISETNFAKFIIEGMKNQLFSEKEAAELVLEFVRNPNLHRGLKIKPSDGMDWHSRKENFEAIWNLTTCTSPMVHIPIAAEYPIVWGDNDTFPNDIFGRMNQEALMEIVWRGYKPLIDKINKNPERFNEEIQKAARDYSELETTLETQERSEEYEEFFKELKELRSEVNERLDAMANQIDELLSRRRGLFG
jgi:hypothetical protein